MMTRSGTAQHMAALATTISLDSRIDCEFTDDLKNDVWGVEFWCAVEMYRTTSLYPDCPGMNVCINPVECGVHDRLSLMTMQWAQNQWVSREYDVYIIPSIDTLADLARRQPVHTNKAQGMQCSLKTADDIKRKLQERCADGSDSWLDAFKHMMTNPEGWVQGMIAKEATF